MKLSLITLAGLLAAGCSAGDDVADSTQAATSLNAAAILDFVNYPDTDEALLDVTAKIDARAAHNITAARNGADGVYLTSDDAPFKTLAQLDAVSYVGPATLSKLQTYALAHPAPTGEVVEGVTFSGWQSVAVVWGVNRATVAELDALLDSRAAKALVAGRPFTSVAQMGPMSYVGSSALGALRDHGSVWWAASKAPGFVLDAQTRADDAEMLKEQLTEDEGFAEDLIVIAGSKNEAVTIVSALMQQIDLLTLPLVGNSYADAVTAQDAIGAAAPLKAWSRSGQWAYFQSIGVTPPTALACVASFEKGVYANLGELEFMSESDRPFDMVQFIGAGAKAPTAASVLALVNAKEGSTAAIRSTADYFTALEGNSLAITAVQNAFGADLKDVTYVAVFAPANDINDALVDVYLVGRTSCGDLVGIHAIAVET